MTDDDQADTQLLLVIRGLYLLTLVGIGSAAFTAADVSLGQPWACLPWLLQVGFFFGVLRTLREVALTLMAAADHE
ncbi:MAG: hypothetical protein V4650_01845 [Pseudomonadota bacterium]